MNAFVASPSGTGAGLGLLKAEFLNVAGVFVTLTGAPITGRTLGIVTFPTPGVVLATGGRSLEETGGGSFTALTSSNSGTVFFLPNPGNLKEGMIRSELDLFSSSVSRLSKRFKDPS